MPASQSLLSPAPSSFSAHSHDSFSHSPPSRLRSALDHLKPSRGGLKRRPTAVRIVLPDHEEDCPLPHNGRTVHDLPPLHDVTPSERTPLIKPGVKPDIRRTAEDVERSKDAVKQVEVGLGKMVELGLPLIMCVGRVGGDFRRD